VIARNDYFRMPGSAAGNHHAWLCLDPPQVIIVEDGGDHSERPALTPQTMTVNDILQRKLQVVSGCRLADYP
jgi:hypothetical protein